MARNRRGRKKKQMNQETDPKEMNAEATENAEAQVENEVAEETANEDAANELSEIEELEIKIKEGNDKYIRLYSEFDNFRKRTAREKVDLINTASSDVLKNILPVLDDFDRAFVNEDVADDPEVLKGGFGLIHKKLITVLEQKGLKAMVTEKGNDFDTDLHEAIAQIPAPEESLKGKIIDTIEKGYYIHDKILRHAKVVIGN